MYIYVSLDWILYVNAIYDPGLRFPTPPTPQGLVSNIVPCNCWLKNQNYLVFIEDFESFYSQLLPACLSLGSFKHSLQILLKPFCAKETVLSATPTFQITKITTEPK